ncbi:MAG: hypothetical protein BRD55_02445 [Bacteroidetes bacterium SW_9_63_38]|nr:MAG: hypothetical protein BRD55_02445 [Bacteroidetes bacterium SW_9_63_38]
MSIEFWYMLPIGIVVATIAMGSGVGGATFFSPLLILGLGLSPELAVGSGLVVEVFGVGSGVYAYVTRKLIDYRIGGLFVGMVSSGLGELNGYFLLQRCRVPSAVSVAMSVFVVSVRACVASLGHVYQVAQGGLIGLTTMGNLLLSTVPGVVIGAQLGPGHRRAARSGARRAGAGPRDGDWVGPSVRPHGGASAGGSGAALTRSGLGVQGWAFKIEW